MKFNMEKLSPIIFSGLAIFGVGVTAYFGAKCHAAAMPEIIKRKKENPDITKKEIVKAVWKHYIPVVVSVGVTTTCIILSNAISAKQLATMTAAATAAISQKNKIIARAKQVVGEEKWKEVEKVLADEEVKETIKTDKSHKDGEFIFYDEFTNYSFYSTKAIVDEAIYRINRILALEGKANVKDFYELMQQKAPWFAAEYGWSIQKGLEEGRYCWIDVEIETVKDDSGDGMTYYRIHYIQNPTTDYEIEGYKEEETTAIERAYQEQLVANGC